MKYKGSDYPNLSTIWVPFQLPQLVKYIGSGYPNLSNIWVPFQLPQLVKYMGSGYPNLWNIWVSIPITPACEIYGFRLPQFVKYMGSNPITPICEIYAFRSRFRNMILKVINHRCFVTIKYGLKYQEVTKLIIDQHMAVMPEMDARTYSEQLVSRHYLPIQCPSLFIKCAPIWGGRAIACSRHEVVGPSPAPDMRRSGNYLPLVCGGRAITCPRHEVVGPLPAPDMRWLGHYLPSIWGGPAITCSRHEVLGSLPAPDMRWSDHYLLPTWGGRAVTCPRHEVVGNRHTAVAEVPPTAAEVCVGGALPTSDARWLLARARRAEAACGKWLRHVTSCGGKW